MPKVGSHRPVHAFVQEAMAMNHITPKAALEKLALQYVAIAGTLAACVEWLVEHDGECLADNPEHLAFCREALAEATRLGR